MIVNLSDWFDSFIRSNNRSNYSDLCTLRETHLNLLLALSLRSYHLQQIISFVVRNSKGMTIVWL